MQMTKKSVLKVIAAAAVALVVGAGALYAFEFPGLSKGETVKAVRGRISIPLSKVSDGKAHFYKFADGGKEIGFFLVKGSDGAIHSAFDSCDVCFREKKGYVQDGDSMQCKNCGKRFSTVRIGPHTVGGCNPSYLPHTEAAGKVVVTVNDLKAGAKYF